MSRSRSARIVLSALLSCSDARATDGIELRPPAPDWRRHLVLLADVGLGTPIGQLGASAEVVPVPWLGIDAGAGMSQSGLQLAITSRGRIVSGAWGFGLGFGASTGRYTPFSGWGAHPDAFLPTPVWDHAAWGNLELAVDHRDDRFVFRVSLGGAYLLNRRSNHCVSRFGDSAGPCDDSASPMMLPYLGVSVGTSLF